MMGEKSKLKHTFATEPLDLSLPSAQYGVSIDGSPLFVQLARVSAAPINQVWPGYQRPLEQTELASFACFEADGPVRVSIECARPFERVRVRPASYGITPEVSGNRIEFTMRAPLPCTVECDGRHGALHLFPSGPDMSGVTRLTENVRYFGPGVHHPGKIALRSGETLYIAAGALVYGCVEAKRCKNINILGRGVLDGSKIPRKGAPGVVSLYDCEDVRIEGIVMRDPSSWTLITALCRRVLIEDVKLIGLWRYNADGIDIVNSTDVTVRRSFIRSFDDSIVIKGLKSWGGDATDPGPVKNIRAEKCVIWCDWGRALEIGAETCADTFDDIAFTDCDIIYTVHAALDIQHGDRARITNVLFDDIRIEMDELNPPYMYQSAPDDVYADDGEDHPPRLAYIGIESTMWSKDDAPGSVDGVIFKNVKVTSGSAPESVLFGADNGHKVDNVAFENLFINGKHIMSAEEANLTTGDYVGRVTFV